MRTAIERGWGDRLVRVSKKQLLAKLKENRTKHRVDYEEALDGYIAMATDKLNKEHTKAVSRLALNFDMLKKQVEQFDKSNPEHIAGLRSTISLIDNIHFSLIVPQDHTRDYDVAIEMAEWSVDNEIEITQSQLQCFIMDDWDWKEDFNKMSGFYKSAR